MTRRAYSEETKAAALADLLAGEQPAVVAQRYGLKAGTVRQWKNRLDGTPERVVTDAVTDVEIVTALQKPSIEAHQQRVIDLVYRNLIAKLEATEHLAQLASNDTWLTKQSAADVAELGTWLDGTAGAILALLARSGNATDRDELS